MPWFVLLKIVAQAVGAAAGTKLADRIGDILDRAVRGDDYKKNDVLATLVCRAASGCPEQIQKIADLAKQKKGE